MELINQTRKLKVIAQTYLSLIRVIKNLGMLPSYTQSLNAYCGFCANVEIAFLSLPTPLKRIINNDFFYQDYPGWWKLSYSKHQYLKLREQAIRKFMEAYNEIN